MKEFWKSVKIWESYWQKFGGFLFGTRVYTRYRPSMLSGVKTVIPEKPTADAISSWSFVDIYSSESIFDYWRFNKEFIRIFVCELAKILGTTSGSCADTETKKLMVSASLSGESWQSRLAKGFESRSFKRRLVFVHQWWGSDVCSCSTLVSNFLTKFIGHALSAVS